MKWWAEQQNDWLKGSAKVSDLYQKDFRDRGISGVHGRFAVLEARNLYIFFPDLAH